MNSKDYDSPQEYLVALVQEYKAEMGWALLIAQHRPMNYWEQLLSLYPRAKDAQRAYGVL